MIFKLTCPTCGGSLTTSPTIFDDIDFRRRDGSAFEVKIDRRPPSVSDLIMDSIAEDGRRDLSGPHPLRESIVPVVEIGCPLCEAVIDVAVGLFVVDASWRERATVADDLVGQRRLGLVSDSGLTVGGEAALAYSKDLARSRAEHTDVDAQGRVATVVASEPAEAQRPLSRAPQIVSLADVRRRLTDDDEYPAPIEPTAAQVADLKARLARPLCPKCDTPCNITNPLRAECPSCGTVLTGVEGEQ